MSEAIVTSFAGWWLLAAMSFRCRRDLGTVSLATVRLLRGTGAALLAIALVRCAAPLNGERFVRFLGAASLSGAVLVLLLSVAPGLILRPVRALIAIGGNTGNG